MLDITRDDFERIVEVESKELPITDTERPHRGGGPRTPEGKSNSSKNGLKHGCRSHILILPDEKQEDFDNLYQRWEDVYPPDTEAARELLEQLVINKWYLERNERRLNQVESQLSYFEFTKWNEQQHKIFQLANRYKTAAERAASKAQRDLEDFLRRRNTETQYLQRVAEKERKALREGEEWLLRREESLRDSIQETEARGRDASALKAKLTAVEKQNRSTLSTLRQEMATLESHLSRPPISACGQNSPKKLRKPIFLEQWVEVKVENGITVTELTPSNDQIIQLAQIMSPPPEIVYRRFLFSNGVPDEYAWTTDDSLLRQHAGIGTQRMSIDEWLDTIDGEKLCSDGHIGPVRNEQDSCECPACQFNRERLAKYALQR